MTERDQESGFEIVVDNRKRIIAFAVIILICGCFFVWALLAKLFEWLIDTKRN